MTVINIKMLISVLLSTTALFGYFGYIEYFEVVDLIINNEVVYTASKYEVNNSLDSRLQDYQNDLIDSSREKVISIENQYSDVLILSEMETLEIVKVSEFEYEINITHKVERITTKVIPFEKETKNNDNQYTDYKEITTKGINGSEETSMMNIYINGEWNNTVDIDTAVVDSVTEITTVGTKEIPATNGGSYNGNYSGGYSNGSSTWGGSSGGSSNGGNSGGYAGGGSSGGSSGGGCPVGDFSCGTWVPATIDSGRCSLSPNGSGAYNCPMDWVPY